MKKTLLLTLLGVLLTLLLSATAAADVPIDAAHFPDDNFRGYVAGFDKNSDNILSGTELANVTVISCSSMHIADLTGIEYFTALKNLYCNYNQLTALDVSNNAALGHLYCSSNQLTALDMSKNPALYYLYCSSNQLTALDVSKNPALHYLYCSSNQLTALDVSNNPALKYLECVSNQLTALDVSQNPALYYLSCYSNQLTALDVSKNPALYSLSCFSNQLTTLDVSKNPALYSLSCYSNQLTTLDVSQNPALYSLSCYSNQLTALDVSQNPALYSLSCSSNQLTALDVSKNHVLIELSCKFNALEIPWGRFELSSLPGFELGRAYDWAGGQVTDGVLTPDAGATEITYTYNCGNGCTTRFRLVPIMKKIEINSSNFPDDNFRKYVTRYDKDGDSTLSETELAAVTGIYCSEKDIADLTGIEHFTALEELSCSENQLTALDVSRNSALTYLSCSSNELTALDVSNNPALIELYCRTNQLNALDVSKNPALEVLSCGENQLSTLDVSRNPALTKLRCKSNQLTALDVSNNPALTSLDCSGNALEIPWGTVELSDLPGFELERASDWEGGIVVDGMLIPGLYADTVSYTYDCGNGFSGQFTLKLTGAATPKVLPADLRRIETEAFMGTGAAAYILPAGIEDIAADAFPSDAILYYPAGTATAAWVAAHAAALPACVPFDSND